MATPTGHTLFCDDIRDEVGGKESYIGVYKDVMYLGDVFPALIPKLCLAITYVEPHEGRVDKVEMQIFLPSDEPDKPSMRAFVDLDGEMIDIRDTDPKAESDPVIIFKSRAIFSPLMVPTEGDIKVRVSRKGEVIKIGRLAIRKAPPNLGETQKTL